MDRIKTWALPAAVAFLAVAILLHGRFEGLQVANALWVLDRVTGDVKLCAAGSPDTCRRMPAVR